ncbi:MAG: hypothetical protein ACI9J3_003980 [Parvicellaceae bacterium]|jgi:hypothetical protein
MNIRNIFFILSVLFISAGSYAQDSTILLLNGKVIDGVVKENDGEFLKYEFSNKKNRFIKEIDILRVYSFTAANKETIVYYQDTMLGNVYSVDEMRMLIYGEADSDKNSKGWPFFAAGAAIAGGHYIFDTYGGDDPDTEVNEARFFGAPPSMMVMLVPFVVPLIGAKIRPRIKSSQTSDPMFLANEQYVIGYQKRSRSKRLMNSFYGILAGTAAGILADVIAK